MHLPLILLFGGIQILLWLYMRGSASQMGWLKRWLLLAPALLVFVGLVDRIRPEDLVAESHLFTLITAMPWPEKAQFMGSKHGWGMQDKRHLWVFKGQATQQAQLLESKVLEPIKLSEASSQSCPPNLDMDKVNRWFPDAEPWVIDELFFWIAPKDQLHGPFGPA